MVSISAKLAELLGTVRQPGDFYASGRIALSIPRLEVDGVGPVALPLLPVQAEQLIAVATRRRLEGSRRSSGPKCCAHQVERIWQKLPPGRT